MNEIKDFDTVILEEVGLLLDLPISFQKVQIFSKEDYEKNKEIRCYSLDQQLILIVPPSLMIDVIHATQKSSFNKERVMEYLKRTLGLKNHHIEDETAFLFLKPKNYSLAPLDQMFKILPLAEDMSKAFDTFKNGCSQEDLAEGLVSLEDSLVFGCFHKNKLIGVASYWFLTDHLADIGVIIHPDYRKKDIGKALVSRLSQWGVNHGKINMYRHDRKNQRSRRLALSLGFEEYVDLKVMKEME